MTTTQHRPSAPRTSQLNDLLLRQVEGARVPALLEEVTVAAVEAEGLGRCWGKKWGKKPHRSQPIPADLDLAKAA